MLVLPVKFDGVVVERSPSGGHAAGNGRREEQKKRECANGTACGAKHAGLRVRSGSSAIASRIRSEHTFDAAARLR